jgi:predicted Zn-dependent peptidase
VTQQIYTHTYENGLVLLAESMDWLESAAFAVLLPAGAAYDPVGYPGLGNFTCDMVQRGCGDRDSRQFVQELERLGVDHSASVSTTHTSFVGAMLADNLLPSLSIVADMLRDPLLPADQLEDSRLVCLQELRSAEDDLAHRVVQRVRQRHYPDPWGRPVQGETAALMQIRLDDVREQFQRAYRPNGTLLSVAGRIDWPRLRDHVGGLLADWPTAPEAVPQETPAPGGCEHLPHDSQQTHLAVAYPSVPYSHPDYFQARGAVGVLSDGMSSRLFTEVREKRGLCYTVHAMCHTLRQCAAVLCYAGTSTDRAQETLDVLIEQLLALAVGIEQKELDRLKARIKSALIMQQESSSARSVAIAADWYHLGRVRLLDELSAIIDRLSADSINRYLADHPPHDFTIVSLGAQELEVPVGIS